MNENAMNADMLKPSVFTAPVTGKRVLVWMVAFFGVIIAVNGAFVYFALNSWPGLTTGRAYEEGLNYNKTLDQAERQGALGWLTQAALGPSTPKGRVLQVRLRGPEGPVAGAAVSARLYRPVGDGLEMTVNMKAEGPGLYTALVRAPGLGRWRVEVHAQSPGGGTYRMDHDLMAERPK